jgi:aryl-alcohol dehydrogenase-like predicted oxidoreductase
MKQRPNIPVSRRGVLIAFAGLGAVSSLDASITPAKAQTAAAPLLTRCIPRSGEALPVIGLGTANGWDPGADPVASDPRSAVIRTLVAAGATLIDTAPVYGHSEAEAVIGNIVAAAGLRRNVFLATKLEEYDRRTGPAQLQASLRRLRTDKIDLMQLHNVSDPHQDLAMLRDWKAQGVCRYIGITTTNQGDFDAAEAVLRREKPDFLEVDYSIEDRAVQKRLIPAAVEAGAAVLPALPFGRGGIFRSVQQRPLPDWASEFGATTWARFFIKYLLGDPAVTAVIPGTSNPVHMADNLAAGRGRPPDAAERRKMVEFFASLG